MSDEFDVFAKAAPKVAKANKAEAERGEVVSEKDAEASEAASIGMDPAEFAELRRDLRRMWQPEPEETR